MINLKVILHYKTLKKLKKVEFLFAIIIILVTSIFRKNKKKAKKSNANKKKTSYKGSMYRGRKHFNSVMG